jgi:hypothetical protein
VQKALLSEVSKMDGAASRPRIVENFNSAYSRENIAITVAKLAGLSPQADFLEINRRADVLLERMTDAQFRRYRRGISSRIPNPLRRMLTIAHRAALFAAPPIPMRIEINDQTPPSLQVIYSDQLISIILNRADTPPV